MKIRSLLRLFSPFPAFFIAAFGLSLSCSAQDLPWQQGATSQDGSRSGNARQYEDPGEPYNPSRHNSPRQGSAPQSDYGQGETDYGQGRAADRGYDSGYDALRNGNRRQPDAQVQQPRYARQIATLCRGIINQRNQPYQGSGARGPYDGRQQYQQPRNDHSRQPYPQQGYQPPVAGGPGQAYAPPSNSGGQYSRHGDQSGRQADRQTARQRAAEQYDNGTYSDDEILNAGHRFFGKITKGLAKVIAHVFKKSGRPTAYILGEEGGGALIAGLRYGEGTVYTKAGDKQRVYWQGPSIGYDFGAEGSKTMILVYNLRNTSDIYQRFGGVDGSAYLVGGVGVTFQKRDKIVLAPIRTGLGLRLGANIGYLKYTRRPTWNPF